MRNLQRAKLIGHFKHVIRLDYPCENIEDIRGPHGQPPTVEDLANAMKRHLEDCEYCGAERQVELE